jgi:hypothetical protein
MTLYQLHKLLGVQQKQQGDFDCLFASVVTSVFTCSLTNDRIFIALFDDSFFITLVSRRGIILSGHLERTQKE